MVGKFRNKYQTKTTRLQTWDYSWNGYYFVTICTKNRENFFGKIRGDKMIFNEIGAMARKYWLEIPKHFSNVKLDEFVIMPNHIHGILIIENEISSPSSRCRDASISPFHCRDASISPFHCRDASISPFHCRDAINRVSTDAINRVFTNAMGNGGVTKNKNPMLYNNLSTIIRWYKGRCTFEINKTQNKIIFAWQKLFYDHIVRNEKSLNNIRQYIIHNPLKWNLDRNNLEKL